MAKQIPQTKNPKKTKQTELTGDAYISFSPWSAIFCNLIVSYSKHAKHNSCYPDFN